MKAWYLLISDLETLNDVSVPRCYFEKHCKLESVQLHCFSDASEKANAAAVYFRSKYVEGQVDVNLVAAKTRGSPDPDWSCSGRVSSLDVPKLLKMLYNCPMMLKS